MSSKKKKKKKEEYSILFCDMDAVLVSFVAPILKLMNRELQNPSSEYRSHLAKMVKEELKRDYVTLKDISTSKKPCTRKFMFQLVKNRKSFWKDLPWIRGGKKLWKQIKKHNPIILTTPMDSASALGKLEWVKNNLDISEDRFIADHEKHKYAKTKKGIPNLLIDDYIKNIMKFVDRGGFAIQHSYINVSKTLLELKEKYVQRKERKPKHTVSKKG